MARMSQDDIRERYDGLRVKLTHARNEVERAQMEIRFLQRECKHPNQRRYVDYDGGGGMFCPDCHKE